VLVLGGERVEGAMAGVGGGEGTVARRDSQGWELVVKVRSRKEKGGWGDPSGCCAGCGRRCGRGIGAGLG